MVEYAIIGSGFSAFIAKLLLGKRAIVINGQLPKYLKHDDLQRQATFEVNKVFSERASSFCSLKPKIGNLRLHDRSIIGGNSKIWGGMVNIENFPTKVKDAMEKNGIIIQSLSLITTGSLSNNLNIFQFIGPQGEILDVSNYFKDSEDGYLESFFIDNNKIGLNVIPSNDNSSLKLIYAKKLIICTGVIQTLDLLFRSNFLNDKDIIGISEYGYLKKIIYTASPEMFDYEDNQVVVRFDISRALSHLLGVQKKTWVTNFTKNIPIYIDQIFTNEKFEYHLKIDGKYLKKIHEMPPRNLYSMSPNGNSIHYCNMRVNNININQFVKSISENVIGLGMGFLDQKTPGPISNDIAKDAYEKICNFI